MQINHNIRAMITQHSLYTNNNAMSKSLEKLSTGLRVNRAQDDAAGLAMSEQMRNQIRGFGKAKQNAQDGIAALQIAEGAMGEITSMLQRQKELAVQAANDTLTSTERTYLNDEFQALTKEINRIALTTDYNGKNVLVFDRNENMSFGATKLNPYDRNVSFLDSSKVLYDTFGSKLIDKLAILGGDEIKASAFSSYQTAIDNAIAQEQTAKAAYAAAAGTVTQLKNVWEDFNKKAEDLADDNTALTAFATGGGALDTMIGDITAVVAGLNALNSSLGGWTDKTGLVDVTIGDLKLAADATGQKGLGFDLFSMLNLKSDTIDNVFGAAAVRDARSLQATLDLITNGTNTGLIDNAASPPPENQFSANAVTAAETLRDAIGGSTGTGGMVAIAEAAVADLATAVTTAEAATATARTNATNATAELDSQIQHINDTINKVNDIVGQLNGIELNDLNMGQLLEDILGAGYYANVSTLAGAYAGPLSDPYPAHTFGGDAVYADARNVFSADLAMMVKVEGVDLESIQKFNQFLRDAKDAYDSFKAAEVGDPKYSGEQDIKQASKDSMANAMSKLFNSDNAMVVTSTITAGVPNEVNNINVTRAQAGNYYLLAEATNKISSFLNNIVSSGNFKPDTGAITDSGVYALQNIFGDSATANVKDYVNTILTTDISKMVDANSDTLAWDHADKQIALAMQKAVTDLKVAYNNFASEQIAPVGTAASEVLHITPNYTRSLGGREASEIMVNYTELNTKSLGMESQDIKSQKSATRAIDQLDEIIKVVSGNRAAIGTYINRLEYTVNNIASMTYNTQEAESRIRDTDFSKETTEFTKNQIMVQSATSILAQANSLPQSVLALIG